MEWDGNGMEWNGNGMEWNGNGMEMNGIPCIFGTYCRLHQIQVTEPKV